MNFKIIGLCLSLVFLNQSRAQNFQDLSIFLGKLQSSCFMPSQPVKLIANGVYCVEMNDYGCRISDRSETGSSTHTHTDTTANCPPARHEEGACTVESSTWKDVVVYVLVAVILLFMVVIVILSIILRKKSVRHENFVDIKSNQQVKPVFQPRGTISNHRPDEDYELYHEYMYVPTDSNVHPEFKNQK